MVAAACSEGFAGLSGGAGGELVGDAGADVVDALGGEAEDGGHGAKTGGDGGLHELAAGADGADGVGEGEGAGGDVGGVLAEGVAGGEGDGEVAGLQLGLEDAEDGDGGGEDRGLGVLGELELVLGALEDELGEGKAKGVVGFLEDGARGGGGVVEGSAHADDLGALAWEEEGNLWIFRNCLWNDLGVDGVVGVGLGHVSFSLDAAPLPRAFCAKSSRHEG